MDGINDEEDQDDDNDGIDDDGKPQLSSYIKWLMNDFKEDSDDDGDGIDDEEEDEDNDGIPNGGLLSSLKLTWMLKLWFFPQRTQTMMEMESVTNWMMMARQNHPRRRKAKAVVVLAPGAPWSSDTTLGWLSIFWKLLKWKNLETRNGNIWYFLLHNYYLCIAVLWGRVELWGGKVYLDELDHFKQNWSKNIFPPLVSQVWFNLFAWTGLIDRDSALRDEIASIKLLELTEQCGAVWCFSSVRDAVLGHLQTLAEPFNDIRGKGNITCRVITSDTWYLRWKLSVCTTSW